MSRKPYLVLFAGGILLIIASLVIIGGQAPIFAQDGGDEPTPNPVGEPPTFLTDIYDAWVASPHADVEAEAFNHWNEDGEVSDSCAQCHSTPGYQDYLGADGTELGVDGPAPLGSVINCDACHNEVAQHLSSVTFPSGVEITEIGDSARCMVCHQGRAWGGTVQTKVDEAGLTEEPHTVSADLTFVNIHYFAAAASLYGSDVMGGYQFAGDNYQKQFRHVEGYTECEDCHQPHTLEIKVNECANCHEDVASMDDVYNIRMNGSLIDYDGDGDMSEGIKGELETMQEMLYTTMQAYATEVTGATLVYDVHSYPYFFADPNGDGELTAEEAIRDNGFNAFTPALLEAAYNYQVSLKDPGAFAHNAKYHIELLYDSMAALNAGMAEPMDLAALNRDDPGHFNSTGEPFRHWDEEGEVDATCAKCHSSEGIPALANWGTTIPVEPSDSLACSTCHDNIGVDNFTLYTFAEVTMPSGAVVSFGEDAESNVCLQCHQGRESGVSIEAAITSAGVGDDEVSDALRFRNPHYFAAGATLFGAEANGAYQFAGMDYSGYFEHERRFNECSECHNEHALTIRSSTCNECHDGVESQEDVLNIRLEAEDMEAVDYDGDGNDKEPIREEMAGFQEALYAEIQNYAANTIGTPIGFNAGGYPYWFIDTNGDGEIDAEEGIRDNAYASWTPNLLRAVYNYTWVSKDPGSFAHNSDYLMQVMYDSLLALGGDDAVANLTRPEVRY